MRRVRLWVIAVLVAGLMVASLTGSAGAAGSAACLAGGGDGGLSTLAECVISAAVTSLCPYSLTLGAGESLHFTSTGKIDCGDPPAPAGNGAQSVTINVPGGNLVMEAGSAILAENDVDGGSGANITITVGGNMTMCGPAGTAAGCAGPSGNPGAKISSSKLSSTTQGTADAGNINITVGNFPNTPPVGNFFMEPGTEVLANTPTGNAGDINITVGNETSIDGHVLSESGKSGTGSGTPGGGPIFVKSGCKLTVTPDGIIRSKGQDPGPDLVHLEGCDVFVYGLVASEGVGHESVTNLCNGDTTAHPLGGATQFTACVEIWGNNIVIDASGANKGEVSADGIRKPNRAWIDLFAQKDVTIIGDTVGNYAVHANAETTSDTFGGLITIKAKTGKITTSNLAIQANATGNGGDGGVVILQAAGNVDFGSTSSIQATAPLAGSNLKGGSISARSFASQVLGSAGSSLNASGDGVTFPGVITLQGCGTGAPGDGVNYTGASTPAATIPADDCSVAMPTLPAAVVTAFGIDDDIWAACGGSARKSGMKFNDASMPGTHEVSEPGLDGWTIHVFGTDSFGNPVHAHATTAGGGLYAFGLAPGTYTVCEQVTPSPNPGFVQSFPVAGTQSPPAACTSHAAGMGAQGYTFTLKAGDDEKGNDFGNRFQQTDTKCPKFPDLVVDFTYTIDPGNPTQIQQIINDPATTNKTVLIMPHLGKKTENIVINKTMKLYGCSITLTAADSSLPVVQITTGANFGLTKDVHATGSTVAGYKIESSNHTILNVRAFNNAIGFLITGNSNLVSGALGTVNNGIGFKVTGNSNTLDTNNGVENNIGDGVLIYSGTGNTVKKYTFRSNGSNGIEVGPLASGTILSENKAYSNTLNGFLVFGANTTMSKNVAGDIGIGNFGDGIRVAGNGGPMSQNVSRSNGLVGIRVTGISHNLSTNTSGGSASQNNGSCQYVVGASNANGGANKTSGGLTFTFGAAGANSPLACVPAAVVP